MTLWEMMRDRVATVMQTVNATASHLFKETPLGIDVRQLPLSIFDGAYSLEFRGYPAVHPEVNTTVDVDVDVRINVAFVFNLAEQYDDATETIINDKREYTRAVNDILSIVLAMQTSPLFAGVEFKGATNIEIQPANEFLGVCGIDFTLSTGVTP